MTPPRNVATSDWNGQHRYVLVVYLAHFGLNKSPSDSWWIVPGTISFADC